MKINETVTVPLCFVDTETTGVHPGRRAWEIAIIRREPDGTERTFHAYVDDVDLSQADPFGLKIGRFYDRHPSFADGRKKPTDPFDGDGQTHRYLPDGAELLGEWRVAAYVEQFTRGAHLVGAVPNFDAETFADITGGAT